MCARSARQISIGRGGLPYISTPTRYSLPARIVNPQIASAEPPMETAICQAGTSVVEMRVNMSSGLTMGIIDPQTTIPDHSGRPMYLLDDREPITELL